MSQVLRIEGLQPFFLGDLHGAGDQALRLLETVGWRSSERWTLPSGCLLVQMGDLIDRGKRLPRHRRARCLTARELESRVREYSGREPEACYVPSPRPPLSRRISLRHLLAEGETDELLLQERLHLSQACEGLSTVRLFMTLEAEAAAAGSRVVCLMGNHELDLLRGAFRHARRQKIYLLALLGVPFEAISAHALEGLRVPELLTLASAELSWLLRRPLVVEAPPVLAVHGGPTADLLASRELLHLHTLSDLEALLQEAYEASFRHPLLEEGRCLLSPGGLEDDFVRRPALVRQFLSLSNASILAVGHSPFIPWPKGQYLDIDDLEIRAQLEVPSLLGPRGSILKLDTDVKRGGPCWLVQHTGEAFVATREDGRQISLDAPLPDAFEPRLEALLPPSSVDGDALNRLQGLLEGRSSGTPPEGELLFSRARALVARLLSLCLTDLSLLELMARHLLEGQEAPLTWLEALAEEAEARHSMLCERLRDHLEAHQGEALLLWPVEPALLVVRGTHFHLTLACVRDVLMGEEVPSRASIAFPLYCELEGQPALEVHRFQAGETHRLIGVPLAQFPPGEAEILASLATYGASTFEPPQETEPLERGEGAVEPEGGGAETRTPTAQVLARLAAFADAVGLGEMVWRQEEGIGGEPPRARYVGRDRDGKRWRLLELNDGSLMPVNTAFTDPAAWYPVVHADGRLEERAHARYLVSGLATDPLVLFASVNEQVAAFLNEEQVECLGMGGGAEAVWQRGRYLFASPSLEVRAYFGFKARVLTFEVPIGRLAAALEAGLVNLNLFLSNGGEVLDSSCRYGSSDVALEVVALEEAGIRWLLEFQRQER